MVGWTRRAGKTPAASERFVSRGTRQGKPEQTDARILWDDQNLYVSFRCQDAHIWAVHTKHEEPVFKDDCVEVFTSPNPVHPQKYFNIEMNVRRAWLDRYQPQGPGTKSPVNWNAVGLKIGTTVQGTLNDDSDTDSVVDPRGGHPVCQLRQGRQTHSATRR